MSTSVRRFSWGALLASAALLIGMTACTPPAGPAGTPTTPGKIKIKYGPFTVPGVNQNATGFAWAMPILGLTPEKGMIWNQPVRNVKRPCDDCYITSMQAGLEYPNGSNANINTGLWLHHMVLLNQGAGRSDPTCAGNGFSLPHFAVGGSPANTERIFASGNERTLVDAKNSPYGKFGYKVNTGDQFHLLVDLMNENTEAKSVYMTIEYGYVPSNTPGYRGMKPVWLDAAQCGTSEVKAKTGKYTVSSIPWRTTVAGQLLGAGGHVHDGGTHVDLKVNGRTVCDTETKYATKPDFVSGGGGMDHDSGGGMDHGNGGGMQHISEQPVCMDNLPKLAAGDTLQVNGYYDDSVHPQMVHEGKLHSVMAIAILYVGQ